MTHIVMTGTDVSMYTNPEGSETAGRFAVYAQKLAELRPHSQLTYIAVGAPAGSTSIKNGNLTIVPVKSLLHLYGALKALPAISLITTQTITEQSWLTYIFALPRHIPVVVQEHGDPFDRHRFSGSRLRITLHRLRNFLALRMLRFASGMRVVSPGVANNIKPYLQGKSLAVLPVPVSISPLPRTENTPILLYIGRLDAGKNVDGFLKVAAALVNDHKDLTIEIAGDGPERSALEKLTHELGLASRTNFHGWMKYGDLAACYARATMFLAPSWHEAFGRVILEALICGAPVISSNTAGPSFILAADHSGILLDAGDLSGMIAAANRLLNNPAEREELRQRGYITAKRFSQQSMSHEWMDFLVRLV